MRELRSIADGQHAAPGRRLGAPRSRAWFIALIVVVGGLLGYQIYHPVKRVIEAVAGLVLVYILANFSTLRALWFLIIVFPFPFAISAGNSTFVFTLVLFVVYLVRASTHRETLRGDRLFNLPIAFLVLSYILSFYNQDTSGRLLQFAVLHTINFFAAVLFFYMIINTVNSERKLARTITVMMVTCSLVIGFTFLELLFPNRQIIPGWLYTSQKITLIMKGARMMGPFHDFELNAEFFAMNVPFILLMVARSRRLLVRSAYVLLALADLFMLFSTVTRGAFISLMVGMLYLAWVSRKDLNFVKLVTYAGAFLAVIVGLNAFVARYTISGSLFQRIVGTTFERGIIPENRFLSWTRAWNRGMEHPFIGHGPGWDLSRGIEFSLWPHDAYLYFFNIGGILGLAAFLFLLVRLVTATLPGYGSSLIRSPLPLAFMKALHVSLVIFIVDQIKIDYLRNEIYEYFIWLFFAMIAATAAIIRNESRARENSSP